MTIDCGESGTHRSPGGEKASAVNLCAQRIRRQGGLMSYGPDQNERFTRVAALIDKILKEANGDCGGTADPIGFLPSTSKPPSRSA